MLPKYIKVKNFTSYFDETINFEDFGNPFCVIGQNGAGKSSIIDMITTVIFYKARGVSDRGTGMDNLINKNADKFEIEYVFTMNGSEYKIIRRKERDGAHELEFYIDGVSQTEKITETQAKINNIIKMDYETFLDTVCIGQGQSGRFMQKKPNERKDVFVQVLGLDKYEKLEQYTKDCKKETKIEIDKIEDKINSFNELISVENYYQSIIQNNDSKIVQYKNIIQSKEIELEKILTEKAQYEQIKKQADHILNQRDLLLHKLNVLKRTIQNDIVTKENLELKLQKCVNIEDKITKYQNIIEQNQHKYNEICGQKSSLETTITMIKSQAKEIKTKYDKLKNYNDGNCNFCGHQITTEYKQTYLNELMTIGKNYISQVKEKEIQLNEIGNDITNTRNILTETKTKLQNVQNIYNQVIQAKVQVQSLQIKIEDLYKQLQDTSEEYRKNIEIKINTIEEKVFNDYILRSEIMQLRMSLTKLESDYAVAKNKIVEINSASNEVDKLNKQFKDLEVLYGDYDDLMIAWGKSGIQAAIIRNALPEIEIEINNLLQILCDGKVTVEFNTEKASKGKKVSKKPTSIETLEIIVNDQGESRTYETYSGGEQFRVDFACHVGLAKFLAKRAGATIDFFIVDEGLGSQDTQAKDNFLGTIKKLSQIFQQIMVITHIPDIQEQFDGKVEVYKDPVNGSKIRIL